MSDVPADMTVQQWDAKYFEDFVNQDWFTKFTSTDVNAPIHVKETLVDKPGNKVHMTLVNELTADALGENDLYSGQEKNITMRDLSIEVHEYGQPVKFKTFEQKKTPVQLRQVYKSALMVWNKKLHRDKIIGAMTDVYDTDGVPKALLSSTVRPNFALASTSVKNSWLNLNDDRVLFGAARGNLSAGDFATSLANVDSTSDKLTPDAIDLMKYMAKHPKTGRPKVRPIQPRSKIDESDYYVLFANSLCLKDLRSNSAFLQANQYGRARGIDNPIFAGAKYLWNNVAIYDIEEMPTLTGVGNSSIDVGVCVLMGAQAIGVAWGKRPWTADNPFPNEYGRFQGMAVMQWYEARKLAWGTGTDDKDSPCDHGQVTGFFSATAYA